MTAYLLGRVEITDPDRYKEYIKKPPGQLRSMGGSLLYVEGMW